MTNIIILTGRAVQHPETKDLGEGKTLTAVRLVVSKDKDDKNPLFIDVSFTGKLAEIAHEAILQDETGQRREIHHLLWGLREWA